MNFLKTIPLKTFFLKRITHLIIFALFLNTLTACIPVLIVGTGAVAGYSLSSDSAIGEIKCDYRSLWDVSVDKLESMKAEISISNESKGLIKAKVQGYDVTVKIDELSPKMQKLKISARRHLLPKPQFAQKIFMKIAEDIR
jgi:hypothetical protein